MKLVWWAGAVLGVVACSVCVARMAAAYMRTCLVAAAVGVRTCLHCDLTCASVWAQAQGRDQRLCSL